MDKPKQVIVFNIEGEDYGIDISEAHEINRLKEITIMEFPKAPDFVEGIISLRGEIVPVINLRKKIGLPEAKKDKNTRIIIVKLDKKIVGIIVDNIIKTIEFEPEEISPVPESMKDVNSKCVRFVGKKENDIVTILDVKELLNIQEENR